MDIEQIKDELRSAGFTENKLNELLELASQEAVATALDVLKDSEEETLDEISAQVQNPPMNEDDALKQLNLIFQKAYGDNYEAKRLELIAQYLQQTLEETKAAQDLLTRYQAGDPTAVATIKAQEGNPDVQKLVDMM